jgi:hypothetical protein
MKRSIALTLVLLLLAVPVVFAVAKDVGNRDIFRIGEATFVSQSEFTVPLNVINDEDIVALDIPLEFTEGVTLNKVTFESTNVDNFDVKISNIDNDQNRVVIGLVSMVNAPREGAFLKPAARGANTVAVLHFTVDDVALKSVDFKVFTTENPSHNLTYVYNETVDGVPYVQEVNPEFVGSNVALNSQAPGVALPTEFSLSQNVPNPFNPTTQVSFALPKAANVNLTIYNVLGQQVKTLVNQEMSAGVQTIEWDGTDNTGRTVASGVYFYRLNAGDFQATKKMLMLK